MADSDSTPDKPPAFQYYPKDYLSDAKTRAMTFKQRGMYWDLVSHCWLEGGLPDDPLEIARILGISTPARFVKFDWPVIGRCFRRVDGVGHQHPRLEIERRKQAVHHGKRSAAGKLGADRRWGAPRPVDSQPMAMPPASDASAVTKHGSSSSSPTPVVPPNPLKGALASDAAAERAGRFMEAVPSIYARCRSGAVYRVKEARDFPTAVALAETYGDRLQAMYEIFLRRTDWDAKNTPGTVGQFAHMAPDCDRLLRESGR